MAKQLSTGMGKLGPEGALLKKEREMASLHMASLEIRGAAVEDLTRYDVLAAILHNIFSPAKFGMFGRDVFSLIEKRKEGISLILGLKEHEVGLRVDIIDPEKAEAVVRNRLTSVVQRIRTSNSPQFLFRVVSPIPSRESSPKLIDSWMNEEDEQRGELRENPFIGQFLDAIREQIVGRPYPAERKRVEAIEIIDELIRRRKGFPEGNA